MTSSLHVWGDIPDSVQVSVRLPRVLIVEDQALIAMDLQMALESQTLEVVGPVASAREAQILLADVPVDAALVDFLLEDGTAESLFDFLNKNEIPYALCTGADAEELSARFPTTPILKKPYLVEDVIQVVRALLPDDASGVLSPMQQDIH